MPDDLSTRAQTEELAEAIRYLQRLRDRPDIDADLADQLQAAIDTALRLGSDGVVDQVQSTVGSTHITLRQEMARHTDMVAGMRDDLHAWRQDQEAIAASHIGAIQEVTAAVTQLRSEFRGEFTQVGERLTGVEATVGEHASEIGLIKDEMAGFRRTRDASIEERRQHAALLRESAADRKRLAAQIAKNERRYQEIHAQLAELLASRPLNEEASRLAIHERLKRLETARARDEEA